MLRRPRRDIGRRAARREPGEREAVGSWREAFLRAPYLRDVFVAIGVLSETFETAITWERFPALPRARDRRRQPTRCARCAAAASVTCRFTHVYPDGPAPYYTILAPARRGAELEQWPALKRAASEAVIAGGGTITHHHAVGRDHRPWYDRQRPEPFAAALRGAKAAVDPAGAEPGRADRSVSVPVATWQITRARRELSANFSRAGLRSLSPRAYG